MTGPARLAAGRYRLEQVLGSGAHTQVWRAQDETLERTVSVRLYDPTLAPESLRERAAAAASLTHPRIVRLFDTGTEDGQFYTVSELVPGSLSWARIPLSVREALGIATHIAEALVYAHQRGVVHGSLHAGNVLIGEQGAKVADFGLASGGGNRPADDLRALGRLLYRMITGHDHGSGDGRPLPDSPKGLARVVGSLMDGTTLTAKEALRELHALQAPPEPVRQRARNVGVGAVVLAVIVGVAVFIAQQLGGRPPDRVAETGPFVARSATDFDPEGDGQENPEAALRAIDHDRTTAWTTERYSTGPSPAGKPGIGLIIDMGRTVDAASMRLDMSAPGCAVELRAASTKASRLDAWRVVWTSDRASVSMEPSFTSVRARWWLVWVTKLTRGVPGAGRRWSCGVSEVQLVGSG